MRKNQIALFASMLASMVIFPPDVSYGHEESGRHAIVREFACGNDPFQQCMDALIRLCGNPARMKCARKYQQTLSQISREAAK